MKKIILSLAVIAVVAVAAVGATRAYFSDTETSTGNTFTAGTIDITSNFEQTAPFALNDMKPSQVAYSNFTIHNSGTNPVNVWKKVDGIVTEENGVNGPEQKYYTDHSLLPQGKNNIDSVIQYDLSVVLKDPTGAAQWNQTLYNLNKTIDQIAGNGTFLGMIPAGWSMEVTESYHMIAETENWAQSDKMTFNITLTGEQLTGKVVLEDKDQVAPWRVRSDTEPQVTFNYGVKDSTFAISSLTGKTVVPGNHSLITYPEVFSTPSGSGYPGSGVVLATVTTDGSGNITGFTQVTTDPGTLKNMKVWLVPSSDLNPGTATFNSWNGANYLFDTGLIDYYKS